MKKKRLAQAQEEMEMMEEIRRERHGRNRAKSVLIATMSNASAAAAATEKKDETEEDVFDWSQGRNSPILLFFGVALGLETIFCPFPLWTFLKSVTRRSLMTYLMSQWYMTMIFGTCLTKYHKCDM
jgi:thiol:disulfide interchange protein